MKNFDITGMSCAACSARVEKAVSGLVGVSSCSVNLLTNSMSVEGEATSEQIILAVEKAGYGASEKGKSATEIPQEKKENNETHTIVLRLIISLVFLAALMYLSMGHTMFSLPLPAFLEGNAVAQGISQLILSAIIMVINQKFFINGFKGAIHGAPNMDTLVALGSGASFVYSTVRLFDMTSFALSGGHISAHGVLHDLYYESAAMILCLITVGKLLEAYSKGKTTNAIKKLIDLSPKTALVIRDGEEKLIRAEDLLVGDIFIVKAGGSIPADAVIVEGQCSTDESALTGESMPVEKKEGDRVSAACINLSGYIKCKAQKVGEDTTLSQIIKMVENASATKAPIAKIADKVSGFFVPVVLVIALVTAAVWLMFGAEIGYALGRAISVLVISCPCALGLATPVAIMVGSGVGAKNGILFKTAEALETAGKTEILVLDKTGTVTEGKPRVTDIKTASDITENELLSLAYALEIKSEHPLARAVVDCAEQKEISPQNVSEVMIVSGRGITASVDGKTLVGGNAEFVENIPKDLLKEGEKLSEEGKTPLYFAHGGKILGIIAVADTVKEDSAVAIEKLKKMGIEIVMLTGDNRKTADAIAKKVGIDEVFSDVMPQDKEKIVREFKQKGKVAMVGDGINDAPALTSADISVAIGAGTDIAIDSADIVLSNSRLSDVATLINLSRKTLKNIKENLFWAFFYNLISIPLAAGVFTNLLGWEMSPMIGAAAMSLSSFCVVTNALRLNFFKANKPQTNKIQTQKEKKKMKKTIKIEGMMCPHCSGRVKDILSALNGVLEANVSHENGEAILTLSKDIANDAFVSAVEGAGYKVISIE